MTIDHLRDGEAEADPNDRATIEEENSSSCASATASARCCRG
jgi:hypothetical protein